MSWTIPVLTAAVLAIGPPIPFQPGRVTPPPVPANLEVPAGYRAFLMASAEGTQNYICMPTTTGVAWTFLGPQATLFDARQQQVLTHFLSPNPAENGTARAAWRHSKDTSTVWAVAIANSLDEHYVAPGAIPWLLLRVVGAEYGPQFGDRMISTTFIQRVNTAGGSAPAAGCSAPGDVGTRAMVPYTTDYVFYR